jgi:hypothetical protein
MKFLSVALFALLGLADAKASTTTAADSKLKARMKNGQFNKQTLMRAAKPYGDSTKRMLDQGGQQYFYINGDYSVSFDSCFSLTVQDEDLFDEYIINYAKKGQVIAQKSYVLFNVCLTEDCYYAEDDAKMTFITDLGTFFQAFADFLPNQLEEYCQGCQENEGYCTGELQAEYYEEEAAEGEEEGDADNEGRRRKLSKLVPKHRKLDDNGDDRVVAYIDCDLCYENNCLQEQNNYNNGNYNNGNYNNGNNNNGNNQYDMEDALDWLEGLSGCEQIGNDGDDNYNQNNYNNYYSNNNDDSGSELFAGLICNDDGTGVEIGVFLNDECTLYAKNMAYSAVMSYSDKRYYEMSQEVVEYMFTNDFSCYQPEIYYTNPWTEQQEQYEQEAQNYNYNYNNNQNQNQSQYSNYYSAPEASEWCQNLFDGEMEALNLYDCGVSDDDQSNYQNNYNDNGNNNGNQYDQYLYTYGAWYSYDISEEAASDAGEVCLVVQSMQGEYSTVYDKQKSGALFDYSKEKGSSAFSDEPRFALNVGAMLGIFLASVIASLACAGWCWCSCCRRSKPHMHEVKPRKNGSYRL